MRLFPRKPAFAPMLSFPVAEAEFIREAYAKAERIVEYGSGGSTLLAAELGKPVLSVESDRNWADMINARLADNFASVQAQVIHVDIGKTGSWGKPVGTKGFRNYSAYALAVWDRVTTAPDLVLIDGRFRLACFCATLMRMTRPTRVIVDDFEGRPAYAPMLKLADPVLSVGRLRVFDLQPAAFPTQHLTWAIASFTDPA